MRRGILPVSRARIASSIIVVPRIYAPVISIVTIAPATKSTIEPSIVAIVAVAIAVVVPGIIVAVPRPPGIVAVAVVGSVAGAAIVIVVIIPGVETPTPAVIATIVVDIDLGITIGRSLVDIHLVGIVDNHGGVTMEAS